MGSRVDVRPISRNQENTRSLATLENRMDMRFPVRTDPCFSRTGARGEDTLLGFQRIEHTNEL